MSHFVGLPRPLVFIFRLIAACAVLFACGVATAQVPAVIPGLRVSGLRDHYCTTTEKITFTVENRTDEKSFHIGFSVERQVPNGEWREYWPDIFGETWDTKVTRAFVFSKGMRQEFTWDLRKANRVFPLKPGNYRLVAVIGREHEQPHRRVILGRFSFIACPETPAPTPTSPPK